MYDDLKRTKHKLIKPYVYDSHSRSAKSIANKALSCRTAVYEVYSQSKTIVLPASIFAKSSLEEDYQFVGYIGKPLTVLRNRLASRSAYVSERLRLFDNRFGGQCTSVILPHYEIFSDCLCTALLGNPICACLGNVSSILKNVEVVESLLRVLGPKPTDSLNPVLTSSTSSNSNGCDENATSASCITPACDVSPRGKEGGVAVSETPGYLNDCSPRRMSQTLSVDDTYGDRCQQDDMLSCLHDDFGSSGDNLYIPADGNGFSNQQEQYSNSRHPCQSEQPTCAFAINGNSYSYTKNYVSESADIIYSCECIPNYQSLSTEDREDILPCLNHNTSLKSSSEGEINCGDQFPFDNMMSLCSRSEFTQFDADLLNEQCLSDVSGQSRAPSFNSPGHDFIDTMIDTYTLSKAYYGGDRQSSLNGDDGARGDGLHFNLGLHQSWWSNGGDAIPVHSKSCFSVMADPTPQDRLARITYKTQPSDAAQAPMFVFSPSTNLGEKLASSSKAIPLDFNLNAVYKLATQSDRVTEEGRLEEPNSKLIPAVRNMAQGTSSSPDSERQTGVALDSSSQKLPESVETARDQVLETDKTNSCEDKREEITPCSISDKESQPCAAIPYVVIAVLVAVMATGLFMCTNKNCFSQLFWEILMHLFLVGVLLMLLITALEANNLTERAVRQLQHILRGCRSPQTSRRQFMILPTNSEHKSEIRSDQLFFDTHSSDPEVLEPAKDPDGRTEVQEMRRSGPSESNAAWLAHFPSDAVPVSPLSAVGGGCETDLVKSNIQANIEPFSDDNTNVRSNPEVGGANTIENVSSFSLNSKLCFGALSSCALDSRLKFQDCCSSTRVVLTTKDAATSSMSACCVAQTMTDFTVLESSYTQTDGAARECRTSSGLQTTEGIPGSDLVRTANVSVQAEMDSRKVYQHMEKLQQRHQSAMKRLQRKFLAIRRRCQVEAMSLKSSERRKNDLLCKLQLNLPSLQKEKSTLLAERASIDKQFEQEKRKNRELVGRLTRLNQQFYRLGQIQQPPTHQPAPWKQHYQQSSYQSSSASRLPGEQTSQQLQKSNTNQSQHGNLQQGAHQTHPNQPQQVQHKIHQQSTLLQNQIRPSVSSTPQQQNLQQPQQQQQHYYHPQQQQQQQPPQQQPQQLFHQQGLPVFQLFNNKSFCQPYLEAYQQQQQQQQPHQQQIHQQKMQQ